MMEWWNSGILEGKNREEQTMLPSLPAFPSIHQSIRPFIHSSIGEFLMKIQILGTGCPKCAKLAENAKEAADAMGIDYEFEKVDKINDILAFGVMMTPALAVDGEVKCVGKVPAVEDIKGMLG
jgi:small redox-active disulfide protein 2